jgi:hypothetical protein
MRGLAGLLIAFLFDEGGWLRLNLDPIAGAGGGGASTEVPDVAPVNGDGQLGGGGVQGGEWPDSALAGLGDRGCGGATPRILRLRVVNRCKALSRGQ